MDIPLEEIEHDKLVNAKRAFKVTHVKVVQVTCSLTNKRLVVPSIGLNCRHQERAELIEFLRRCIGVWICPICKVHLPYYEIYVDQVLMEALESTVNAQDVSAIKFTSTYEWEVISTAEAQKSAVLNMVLGKRLSMERRNDQPDDLFYGVVKTTVQPDLIKTKKLLVKKVQLNTAVALKAIPNLTPSTAYWMPFGSSSVFKFEIADNTWKPVRELPSIGNVAAYYSVLYLDSFVMTIGGIGLDGKSSKQCFLFSEELGLKRLPDLSVSRHSFAAATTQSKRQVYVFGGLRQGHYLSHCETYNLKREQWEQCSSLISPRACASASIGSSDTIYLLGGCEEDILIRFIDKYYISTNSWVRLQLLLNYGVQNSLAFKATNSSVVLLFGGNDLKGPISSVCAFNTDDELIDYNVPQLPEPCGDHCSFPVLYDSASKSAHFFNVPVVSRQLQHFFYDVSFLRD